MERIAELPPLSKEQAYILAVERGLIQPEESFPKSLPPLTKEQAYELALQRRLIQPEDKSIGRSLSRGARNVASGVWDIPDLVASPVREGLNIGASALGYGRPFNSMGEAVAQGIDTATEGYTAPQSKQEKIEEAVTRGVASMPVGGALGAGLKILKHAPKMVQLGKSLTEMNAINPSNLAGSMATSGMMQSHINENPGDIAGAMASGLLGGIGAQGAMRGATALGASALGKTAKVLPEHLSKKMTRLDEQHGLHNLNEELATRTGHALGINPRKVEDFLETNVPAGLADVSDKKAIKMLSHHLEVLPFAGEPITKLKNLQRQKALSTLEQGDYGDIISKGEAGTLSTKGAKAYQKAENKTHAQMFGKIENDLKKMSDRQVTPLDTMKHFSEQIAKNSIDPDLLKDYLASPEGKVLKKIEKTSSRYKGELPYEVLKRTLRNINNKIKTHGLIGKVDEAELKNVASLIDNDIERSMTPRFKKLGEGSYENWKNARHIYHAFAEEDIPKLNELYKKDKKGAVDVFLDLVSNQKKDAKKTQIILSELQPEDQKKLLDAVQKRLGETSDGTFSILKWNRGFKNLESEAKEILLSPLNKGNRKKVMDITHVVDHLKGTLEEANSSKSGYYNTFEKIVHGATSGAGLFFISGNPLPIGSIAMGLAAGRMGSHVMTDPKLINWMYNGMKIKNLSHLERHLGRLGQIKGMSKTLAREAQTLQHDLEHTQKKKR